MRAETDQPLTGILPIMTDIVFMISLTSFERGFAFRVKVMTSAGEADYAVGTRLFQRRPFAVTPNWGVL